MTSIIISPASLQDAAPVAALSGQLGYPSTKDDLVERLSSMLGRDDHLVLVAKQGGNVVGWLHAFVAFRVESPASAELGGLVVAESARGKGIGLQLVRAASKWARWKGLQKIRVRANVARKETHDFYLHIGFKQLKTQMVFSMAADAE